MIESLTEEVLHKMTSQELTYTLYIGLKDRLEKSIQAINLNHFEEANKHLQNCNDILFRLGAGINYEAGIIADQLETIYQYLAEKCIEANIKKEIKLIEEIIYIVKDLTEAWELALNKSFELPSANRMSRILAYEVNGALDFQVDVKE